jgi:hypothetical protein
LIVVFKLVEKQKRKLKNGRKRNRAQDGREIEAALSQRDRALAFMLEQHREKQLHRVIQLQLACALQRFEMIFVFFFRRLDLFAFA